MSKKIRCVAIDNGGSEIRIKSGDKEETDILTVSNDIVTIEESDFRVKDVADETLVCRVADADDVSYCGIYASGIVGKSYEGMSISLTNQSTKTGNDNFYKQMIYSISMDALKVLQTELKQRFGSQALSLLAAGQSAVTQFVDNLEFDYGIVACIPIREYNGSRDCVNILKDKIKGSYTVEFPLVEGAPTITFKIDRENIGVVPEGGVAVAGLPKEVTDDAISLVIDMGHVTTDIALFRGKTLMGRSVSSPYAGSTLIGNLRSVLNDEGYFLTEEQAVKVLMTDTVMRGATAVSVKEIVDAQRKQFVRNYIQKEVIQVLNINGINARQVQYVVPIGALMNSHDKENSIESHILRNCGLTCAAPIYICSDLRYVNIKQAAKFAEHILKKMMARTADDAVVA